MGASVNRFRCGVSTISDNLQNIGKITFKMTLALSVGVCVKSVDATVVLPAGVTAAVDSSGATLNGVLVPLIGGTNTLLSGSSRAPGMLKLILLNGDTGFLIPSGDVVIVAFCLDPEVAVPNAVAFTLSNYKLFDRDGAEVGGTLSFH